MRSHASKKDIFEATTATTYLPLKSTLTAKCRTHSLPHALNTHPLVTCTATQHIAWTGTGIWTWTATRAYTPIRRLRRGQATTAWASFSAGGLTACTRRRSSRIWSTTLATTTSRRLASVRARNTPANGRTVRGGVSTLSTPRLPTAVNANLLY